MVNWFKGVIFIKHLVRLRNLVLIVLLSNILALNFVLKLPVPIVVVFCILLFIAFILINIKPSLNNNPSKRLKAIYNGKELIKLFCFSFLSNICLSIVFWIYVLPHDMSLWLIILHFILMIVFEIVLLLNGIIRIVTTSVQLGVKWRILLFLFWWIPVVNCVLVAIICKIVSKEYELETEKQELNDIRKENETCKTKYPLLLVHGVFFRDLKYFNYWGRIPKELMRNGATIYYGEQQSAASIAISAEELKQKILKIIEETKCKKVNIIAHSKGGLDARYAISCLGMDEYVASLTTISTPHRGCAFADYLLNVAPKWLLNFVSKRYNSALKKLGDTNPDFMGAIKDLTLANCKTINAQALDKPNVYYQSFASRMKRWTSAPFPQCLSYILVHHFNKKNDGLVDVDSAKWGDKYQLLTCSGNRGISHGDMIDLYRENIKGFDVRELFVDIVKGLKESGF